MERREILKGILGGLATVTVGSKAILSKAAAEELNTGLSKEVIEYVPNPYMVTSTVVIPPHKVPLVYKEGDLIEQFSVSADTRRASRPRVGDLVTLNSNYEIIYYDVPIEDAKKKTGKWSNLTIGRVIEIAKDCWTCTVLIRNKDGWVW